MKQFFKMVFASALGIFLAGGFLILLSFSFLIGMVNSLGSTPEYVPKTNIVFKIPVTGVISETVQENPFAALTGTDEYRISLHDLLRSIRLAKENPNISGIYLEGGILSAGTAHIDAVREALLDFKESGKFIVVYAGTFTQGSYYLCSVADQIYLNPQGNLLITGLMSETTFYKGLMDKVGVQMNVFKVGTHKGFPEKYTRTDLSNENREQISSYQQGIWTNITQNISQSRNISPEVINQFADQGLAFGRPEEAVEMGLVDDLKYRTEVEDLLLLLSGQSGKKLETAGLNKMKTIRVKPTVQSNHIAVIYAEGEIKPDDTSIYSSEQVISEKLVRELVKLKNDEKVKAVVMRVNSPGGSAYISDQIWHEMMELKQVKPVVVSMGNVAASGGYYISCAADKIIAEPTTLTGSIGIFGLFPNIAGLMDKIGVTTDIVKTNRFGDFGDISRPMREDEKMIFQQFVDRGYETFITRCADGRGMTKEEIDQVAQGRVWTGEQALERGLIDQLGNLNTAVEVAAELADLQEYGITYVDSSKDLLKELLEKRLSGIKTTLVKEALGSEYDLIRSIHTKEVEMGLFCRLPFDITPL
ncbi:MAG: signal peptide peptidase SppA [Tannerellaceae bacterium]|nr:signal peptide peptidase SppA [Tannerellaceae bacterium]